MHHIHSQRGGIHALLDSLPVRRAQVEPQSCVRIAIDLTESATWWCSVLLPRRQTTLAGILKDRTHATRAPTGKKASVAIDLSQPLINTNRRSGRLLEGLLAILISSLTNLARNIRVYQSYCLPLCTVAVRAEGFTSSRRTTMKELRARAALR